MNRGPGYESMQLCLPDFWKRCPKHGGKKIVFLTNIDGETGYLHAENFFS
jgi:hypothetical protein